MNRIIGLSAFLLASIASAGCSGPPPLQPPMPPTVGVTHAMLRDYAPTKEFVGHLETKDPVKVQPQVTGVLLARRFKDGDMVKKRVIAADGKVAAEGTLLYEIDPILFAADVKKAQADLLKAEADMKNWSAQIQRDQALLARVDKQMEGGVGSANDRDVAFATVQVDRAQLEASRASKEAAEAALNKAQENLRYCRIYASTDGRIKRNMVAEGNTVTAYQTTLTEIYPVNPIYAIWDVDELTSLWYREQVYGKNPTIPDPRVTPLQCEIMLKNEKSYSRKSTIDYTEPIILRGTGTRVVRSLFPNPDEQLSSGDSVRVRVAAGKPAKVLMIPETVVLSNSREKFVYVLNEKDQAEIRTVELSPGDPGWLIAVQGLAQTDRIVADNLLHVRPGITVAIRPENKGAAP